MRACVALVATALGCKHEPPGPVQWQCEPLPFAQSTPLPEASAAAWLVIDGKEELVVVADSGNDGAYAIVDPETGETREQGKLPLGGGGDDIEGAAGFGATVFGLTSDGIVRRWVRKPDGAGFELVGTPYELDAKNLNFEGLCLVSVSTGFNPLLFRDEHCIGYAAAKADGKLYCLNIARDSIDQLVLRRDRPIAVTGPNKLADCTYGEDGTLWAGGNVFELGQVYRIEHDQAVPVAKLGIGNPEVLAVRGDHVFRMSDTNAAPSLMSKFRCTAGGR